MAGPATRSNFRHFGMQLSYMANHCDQEVSFILGKKPVRNMKGCKNMAFDISSDDSVEHGML